MLAAIVPNGHPSFVTSNPVDLKHRDEDGWVTGCSLDCSISSCFALTPVTGGSIGETRQNARVQLEHGLVHGKAHDGTGASGATTEPVRELLTKGSLDHRLRLPRRCTRAVASRCGKCCRDHNAKRSRHSSPHTCPQRSVESRIELRAPRHLADADVVSFTHRPLTSRALGRKARQISLAICWTPPHQLSHSQMWLFTRSVKSQPVIVGGSVLQSTKSPLMGLTKSRVWTGRSGGPQPAARDAPSSASPSDDSLNQPARVRWPKNCHDRARTW